MLPFGYGHQGLVDLSKDEVDDLVAYIRRWSTQTSSPMTIPAALSITAESHDDSTQGLSRKQGTVSDPQ